MVHDPLDQYFLPVLSIKYSVRVPGETNGCQ